MTAATVKNERLRVLLNSLRESPAAFAAKVGVDPKTVERWITTGRRPYPRIAHRVAQLLEVEVTYLWPDLYPAQRYTATDELVACYPGRAAVPADLWVRLLAEARTQLTLVGDCGLNEAVPNLPAMLADKAAAGVPVRVVLTDPITAVDPVEAARAQRAEATVRSLLDTSGISITRYSGVLTTAVIVSDDDLMVRTSIDGCPAAFAPLLHLRRLPGGPLAGVYLTSVDTIVYAANPLTSGANLRVVA
jgi:lambda repressor-like predicted transcriptional regulator